MDETSLRIALLSYRAHPEVGGQGVYVDRLSRALAALGHRVTVLAGPPYPDDIPGVELIQVPSLDLYRPEDPFRRPARSEFRSPVDVLEYGLMCTGAFPEPLTFSLRVAARLASEPRFDVVHDNQGLGYGLLQVARRLPLLATIHHPISVDRRLALASTTRKDRVGKRRWYSFVRMQGRVARRLPRIVAVSEAARDDVISDFKVKAGRIGVVHNGVDADLFRPLGFPRTPGRIVAIASSDQETKGLDVLVEAVAKLATERDVSLVVIGRGGQGESFRASVRRFGIADRVHALGRIDALSMVEEINRAEVAVVPSLYEGFSLPAVEFMSCGVPLVSTTGGALREVVGDAGMLVAPGDPGELAAGMDEVLGSEKLARRLAAAGRQRVLERYTWAAAARSMVEEYRSVMQRC